jgi:ATP-binding protein involved in chromosome partitioning
MLLGEVIDPELGVDIVELGMVPDVAVDNDGAVSVTVALTTMGCPLRAQLRDDVKARLGAVAGVMSVDIEWTVLTQEGKAHAMSVARQRAADNAPPTMVPIGARVLAIGSGKGGVGKSSVTVNLAAALAARGLRVGVLDADIWGFSVPRLLGVGDRLESRDGKIEPGQLRVGAGLLEVVSMGLLVEDEQSALMWRGLMLNRAVQHFLEDVRWGELDYLLIDLPPGTGDVQLGLARMLPRTEVLVVTTPARNAQKVAARAVSMARKSHLRVVGVVENMTDFTCAHGDAYALFGSGGGEALAAEAGVPLLAQLPIEPAVSIAGDEGRPVALGEGAAAEAFAHLAEHIVTVAAPPVDLLACSAFLSDGLVPVAAGESEVTVEVAARPVDAT